MKAPVVFSPMSSRSRVLTYKFGWDSLHDSVLFFLGVAVQAEARIPGSTCQVPQLYLWTGEELCGA